VTIGQNSQGDLKSFVDQGVNVGDFVVYKLCFFFHLTKLGFIPKVYALKSQSD